MQASAGAIWVIKFRKDGNFVATGGVDGVLRVWKIVPSISTESLNLIEAQRENPFSEIKPYREFEKGHKTDIFDINWCSRYPYENYLCTAGSDLKVIVWNLNDKFPVQILPHPDIESSAVFKQSQ